VCPLRLALERPLQEDADLPAMVRERLGAGRPFDCAQDRPFDYAQDRRDDNASSHRQLCGLGFGGASGPATAGRFGGFVEQVAFRLQPVLQLISGSAAALEVDFIGAKPDLFRCWMSFGSSRLGLRRWSNVHGLGHEFLLPFVSSGRSKATEQSIEQGRVKRARET